MRLYYAGDGGSPARFIRRIVPLGKDAMGSLRTPEVRENAWAVRWRGHDARFGFQNSTRMPSCRIRGLIPEALLSLRVGEVRMVEDVGCHHEQVDVELLANQHLLD